MKKSDGLLMAVLVIAIGFIGFLTSLTYMFWQMHWSIGVLFLSIVFILVGIAMCKYLEDD